MIRFRFILMAWTLGFAKAASGAPDPVDFEQKIGTSVPRDLEFRNDEGRKVKLAEFLDQGKPTILSLAYFHCKTLCPLVLDGLVKSSNDMETTSLPPFQVIVVSIDPRDTPEDAAARKKTLLRRASRPLDANSLHILTGSERAIQQLADTVGFRYRFDASTGQYQHPSGLTVLTGDGRISRYFFGIEYQPKELQAALTDASRNGLGRMLRQLVLACYRYNATTGTYTLEIYRIMRVFAVFLLIGGGAMVYLWEHRRLQPK
ncbi:MAG TPA: SCO family protein [Oligoflexus sp.]|uniref:SCO family protein n=1 Tax=Oligoflexus sp. TaxID=1971216 RepID=UPI002D800A28|nr:SCO family protein [Oligoflexus sp.]HET9240135.1 SCO family protein [Oligoflexus sp.]